MLPKHKHDAEQVNLKSYLTVREAADLLGVHSDTLRRWEKSGKLNAFRHPINNYRLYTKEALENLLSNIKAS